MPRVQQKGRVMTLQERVEQLEKENRRMKRIGCVAAVLILIGAALGFQSLQDQQDAVKARQARLQLGMLNQITQGQDTAPIMKNLIGSAKNGDMAASRILVEMIFANNCSE